MHADQDGSASASDRPGFQIRERWTDRLVVLSIEDAVDQMTAPLLSQRISAALEQSPAGLVVDLTDVTFLASAGMTTLVKAQEQAGTAVRFGIVAVGPTTRRPLKLLGLDTTLAIYPTLDAALSVLH
jgi:anti-sigma B factor antagonist